MNELIRDHNIDAVCGQSTMQRKPVRTFGRCCCVPVEVLTKAVLYPSCSVCSMRAEHSVDVRRFGRVNASGRVLEMDDGGGGSGIKLGSDEHS